MKFRTVTRLPGAQDITVVRRDGPKPKHFRARVEGDALLTSAWTEGGKARETRKAFPSEATREWEKVVRKKMREGFVFVRAEAAFGDVEMRYVAPGAGVVVDIAPDGETVFAAFARNDDDGGGYTVVAIGVATGEVRVLREEKLRGQTFTHGLVREFDGTLVLSVSESGDARTLRLDPTSGTVTTLTSYAQHRDARFNPHCVVPARDASGKRLLVYDANDVIRVREGTTTVIEKKVAHPTIEVRHGALSPSGKRLALFRASRGVVYGHGDALHDTTNEVVVYDVDEGEVTTRFPLPKKGAQVGFTADETQVLASFEFAQGPAAFDIATGAEAWHIDDPSRDDRWWTSFAFAASPDGKRLANGDFVFELWDLATREPELVEHAAFGRVQCLAFSHDGTRVVASTDQANVFVVRAR